MPFISSFSGSFKTLTNKPQTGIVNLRHTIKWSGFAVGDGGLDVTNDGTNRVFIGNWRHRSGDGRVFEVDLSTGNVIAELEPPVGSSRTFFGFSVGYIDSEETIVIGAYIGRGYIQLQDLGSRPIETPERIFSPFGANLPSTDDYGWHISTNKHPDETRFSPAKLAVGSSQLVEVRDVFGLEGTTLIDYFESPVGAQGFGRRVSLVEEKLVVSAVETNQIFVYNVRDSSAPLYNVTEASGTLNYGYGLFSVPGKFFVGDGSKVYVYDIDTGNKLQEIADPLPNGDGSTTGFGSDDRFDGFSRETANPIWANSKYLVIGAPFSNKNGTGQGRAYIYDIESYELLLELDNPDPSGVTPGGHFGCNVALNEDYLVVIARFNKGDDGSNYDGNMYIYEIS